MQLTLPTTTAAEATTADKPVAKSTKLKTAVIGNRECVLFNGSWIGIE